MMKKKDGRLYMRIPSWLKETAESVSSAKGVSLSKFVEDAIMEAVIKKGVDTGKKQGQSVRTSQGEMK